MRQLKKAFWRCQSIVSENKQVVASQRPDRPNRKAFMRVERKEYHDSSVWKFNSLCIIEFLFSTYHILGAKNPKIQRISQSSLTTFNLNISPYFSVV